MVWRVLLVIHLLVQAERAEGGGMNIRSAANGAYWTGLVVDGDRGRLGGHQWRRHRHSDQRCIGAP